jgi:hypothetical protein
MTVIRKIPKRLPGWKRGFLTYPGKELLVKTVLSAMPTYFLTILRCPSVAMQELISLEEASYGKARIMETSEVITVWLIGQLALGLGMGGG